MKRLLTRGLSWSITFVSAAALAALGLASCTPPERNFGDNTGGSAGAGGGDGGGGAGGSAMLCMPDTQTPCYTGPDGTLEVGACKGGLAVCLPSGAGYGECGGEVIPQVENCLTTVDEACNGNDPTECPALGSGWLKVYGSIGFGQVITDVAITPAGDIIAVGGFADTIDFGNGPMASTGASDIFIAKFDPLGNAMWSKRFGDASSQIANAVGVDSTGAIYVGGSMAGSVDFGSMMVKTSNGGNDAFLAKFDADGNVVWAQNYGDTTNQGVRLLEITKTNLVVIAGDFSGVLSLNPNISLMSLGGTDVFVARFDGSGFLSSARQFGGQLVETVRGLAVDNNDRVYITGGFDGQVNFGQSILTSTGSRDAYVAAMTPMLQPAWAQGYGHPAGGQFVQEGYDVAVSPLGEVYVSGTFADSIDTGGFKLYTKDANSRGLYISRLGLDGITMWSNAFGGAGGNVSEARLAIDGQNQLVVAGHFTGALDFGTGVPMLAENNSDPFLAKLVGDGVHIASRSLPNEIAVLDNPNTIQSLALLPTGDLIISGVQRTPVLVDKVAVGEPDGKEGNAMLGRFIP